MASRAERRAICALVLCECCKETMLNQGASKSMRKLLDRLDRALSAAFAQWEELNHKDVKRIHQLIVEFDKQTFNNQHLYAPVHTSVMLGLMDALKRAAKDKRSEAAARVERALRAVHRYYDRQLDRHKDYALAAEFLQIWDRVLAEKGY